MSVLHKILNMSEHARIMPEYAGIFQNVPKSAWLNGFVLFPHSNLLST